MDVREKLVELIKDGIRHGLRARSDDRLDYSFEDVADHMIANGVTVQEWISVAERLPDDGETVLTHKNGITEVQMYEKMRNGWISGNWFWSMATVTHWMPIPQPPKGE